MRLLRSIRVRLFLTVSALCALHFATNVVREHYPALALAEHLDLRCDEWAEGWPEGARNPDLFRHDDPEFGDGHFYANNQVGASLVAAPFLILFRPALFVLEEIGRRQEQSAPAQFDSRFPRRQAFMAEARRRGIHLQLGAVAAITAVLVMAPLAGLLVLLVHAALLRCGTAEPRASRLALLFAAVTPLVFRSAILNHNQMQAVAAFGAFLLLWRGGAGAAAAARREPRFVAAGALAGATVLLDYSGAVLLAALGLLATFERGAGGGLRPRPRAALRFALGALGAIALLWLTQWWQFGHPFAPAQRFMPDAHFSVRGWHGLARPHADLLAALLLDPSYGLLSFAPFLLLALLPRRLLAVGAAGAGAGEGLPRSERRFVLLLALAFVLFAACNQFSRLQWNTGFRGLAPIVPFLFLAAVVGRRVPAWLWVPCALHSWVLAMARATPAAEPASFADSTIARSWAQVVEGGIQLPWWTVFRQTQQDGGPAWMGMAAPALVIPIAAAVAWLWRRQAGATA
jgi:hypothetical protein